MAIVGPRPLSQQDTETLRPEHLPTLTARPGMTGRWQVDSSIGASEDELRAADTAYMRRWRIRRDIEMILRIPVAIVRRGRYLGDTEISRQRARLQYDANRRARENATE